MGKLPIVSVPLLTTSHNAVGESTPPGNRHAIPTTAMGSSTAGAVKVRTGIDASAVSLSWVSKYPARALGVGWSKTRVDGSVRPLRWVRALRSSNAVSESMPRSLNGRSGFRLAGSG
ncbi:hypothetical protein MSIMFB_03242 [Mycobacterium simulans]|uniref:Uncharacterized protein n=1 Tax=Mycobacterium simulans TaxID=627089 RepID=A0A7Z7ILG0_9MYCO|nr:hypothetical protein MSIMFB_03242 [Mycobacterium simulans]